MKSVKKIKGEIEKLQAALNKTQDLRKEGSLKGEIVKQQTALLERAARPKWGSLKAKPAVQAKPQKKQKGKKQ